MDIAVISGIFLGSAGIVALLILLMSLETDYLKKLAILAVILFISPLLIAVLGNAMAWFEVRLMDIVLLRQGAFSILAAASYGVIAGSLLNFTKKQIASLWRNRGNSQP